MTDIIEEIEAAIVPVKIHADNRKKSKRYLRTTLHSYSIDPTNNPTALVAPFNPNRQKVIITASDAGVTVTQDNPAPNSQVSTASSPPQGASAHCGTQAQGFNGVIIYGPQNIWAVAITAAAATRVNVIQYIWCYDD